MQRLFSTFPNGWPGYGLLLLRVSCAVPLLVTTAAKVGASPLDAFAWMQLLSCLAAVFVLAGLWTPLAASGLAGLQTALAFSGSAFALTHLLIALMAVSLVMLGPGAWSIDSRLYGRKRIDLGHS